MATILQRATDIAEQMVGTYGMSETLGPLPYDKQEADAFSGVENNPRRTVSDATARRLIVEESVLWWTTLMSRRWRFFVKTWPSRDHCSEDP